MTLLERLAVATELVAFTYIAGGLLFFVARSVILVFVKKFAGDAVPKRWLIGVLGYPAATIYAFAIHPVAGSILLLPILIAGLAPELFIVNERAEPSVRLPEKVKLTRPLRKAGSKRETRVIIDGESWAAEWFDDGLDPPSPGQFVRIVGRQGLKLVIARVDEQ